MLMVVMNAMQLASPKVIKTMGAPRRAVSCSESVFLSVPRYVFMCVSVCLFVSICVRMSLCLSVYVT